jgi:hypothetical protein
MKKSKSKLKKSLFCILIIALLYTYGWPWAATLQIGSTQADVTIAFEGAGKGLDPQGNRFDINEIKSDTVLAKAIEESGLEDSLTADGLKRRLFILPQAEKDTLRELLTLTTINGKTQDIKERMIYPTSYIIGLKDMGVPSYFSDKKLLDNILKAYTAQLKSKYLSDTFSEPAYTQDEILRMDYPEMMMVLNQEAESLLLYIDSYASGEPQFTSEKTGLSFSDVYQQAALLKSTDIGNMRSLVDYYELTEDAQNRILYEETMLKRAEVISNKLQGAQLTAADILQVYDNSSNYIFASGGAGSANLEPVENQFYADLMNALVDKQTSFIKAKYSQQDIQNAIAKLQAGSITGEAYINLTAEIKSGTQKAMDRIEALKGQTREMAEEFYDSNVGNKIYTSSISYGIRSNGNILINFAALAVLCIVISWLYYDIKHSSYNGYLEIVKRRFRRK